tara:strand:+ start:50 stop:2935 length:2886 start_codon:yes stop_codon:yes gene_type:complete
MVTKNNSIFCEYIELYNKYKKLYGEKTIVLMQVGSFFEIYSCHNKKVKLGPDTKEIIDILNVIFSKRNKNIDEITENNYQMAGWPVNSLDKYVDILLNNKYTIIIVEQFDNEMGGNAKKERKVTEILSPTTTINNTSDYNSKYLMSIYFYKFKNRKTKKTQLNFSLSVIDLSIGKSYLYEDINKDEKLLFDNVYRIILKFNPEEIIVFGDDIDFNLIKNNINFNNKLLHNKIDDYNKDILNINYQTELLKKVYKNIGMLTPIEYIDLEKNQELLISFIKLIEFAYSHNEKIIENLYKPEIIENNTQLILGYNLVNKLDIVNEDNSKFSCLLNILNNSSTNMGKRYLKNRLLNPDNSVKKINESYENNNLMLLKSNNKYIYETIREKLKNISDLERYIKKVFLLKLHPQEFINIHSSIKVFSEIIKDLNKFSKIDSKFNKFNKLNYSRDLLNLIKFINENLNLENINKYNLNNIDGHIFQKGVFNEIDNLQEELDLSISSFTDKADELNNIDKDFNGFFKVECNDNLGYFLQVTNNRFNIFKRNSEYNDLDKITTKKVSASSNTLRLWFPEFNKINNKIEKLRNEILEKCIETYKTFCQDLIKNYDTLIDTIINDIKIIDYATTNAYNCILYKYSEPLIKEVNGKKSWLKLNDVRHPIIEVINEEIKYIANNVELGNEKNGILLYGMNSAGKSSLMKSIGLSIIMAQAGMFVPCTKMEYYPYNKLYSRIPGGDNIFKGQSTFVGEISEIRNILKSSDNKTLIIGDELCSGTETNSAIAIVSAGILDLINKKSSFIFATHLHELASMKRITELEDLSIKHLSVKYDSTKNLLIFDRRLKDGSGDSVYGLEVCRSLDLDSDFLKLANEIRQEVLGTEKLIKFKKSKYNANLIVDKCNICKKDNATETHHIYFQKDADDNGFIDHYHKNKKFNLVGLCEKCHDKIHNGELEIGQATMTSNGIMYG